MERPPRPAARPHFHVLFVLLVLVGLLEWPSHALATVQVQNVPAHARTGATRPGRARAPKASKRLHLTRVKVPDRHLSAALAVRPVTVLPGIFAGAPAAAPSLSAPERASLEESLQDDIAPPIASPEPPVPPTPPLIWPTRGPVNSPFGPRRGGFHVGIDIGAPRGQAIVAAADGLVLYARASRGPMGHTIVLQHAAGLLTIYAHLARLWATEGTTVRQGEPVGAVGSTGHSTGPHLHFAVRADGRTVNPRDFLPAPDDVLARSAVPQAPAP